MIRNKAYKPQDVDFQLGDIVSKQSPYKVLLCSPDYFEILDVKNSYMSTNVGSTQQQLAIAQWNNLRAIYSDLEKRNIIEELLIINGEEGCEDMVFCANQTFPWISEDGTKMIVLSNMRHDSRKQEIQYFDSFFKSIQYDTIILNSPSHFEGMGDAIPLPGKNLIFGGYGFRTDFEVYERLADQIQAPIISLELVDESFYHLDTCFLPLDSRNVILYPQAFSEESYRFLEQHFECVITIPKSEAKNLFSINAHCFTGMKGEKVAIIQEGATNTIGYLNDLDYEIFETDTSEFMKSGGSVFCMKMMLY